MQNNRINRYPLRSPRLWMGMDLTAWLGLLEGNMSAISTNRYGLIISSTLFALLQTLVSRIALLWETFNGLASRSLPSSESPIFIIGHWRSGTTLLHELLCCFSEFKSPTTYQCFCPQHFLLTERIVTTLFSWVIPKTRIFDSITLDWNSPQEDEFALLMLGAPSPYRRIAFPCFGDQLEGLDINKLPLKQKEYWCQSLVLFVKRLMFNDPRRLILKSPTHTARISILLKLFPCAKFIFISRDPLRLIPSTIKLWKFFDFFHGLNSSASTNYLDYTLNSFKALEEAYLRDRPLLNKHNLIELRFEDLIVDPASSLQSIASSLYLVNLHMNEACLASVISKISSNIPEHYELTTGEEYCIREATHNYRKRYKYK
jgi:omega-hydroxy-beta-dihydromenaquinone-9 sulfotransferase